MAKKINKKNKLRLAIKNLLIASEILDLINYESASKEILLIADFLKSKNDVNELRSIVNNNRLTMENRKTNDVTNTFGPMGPYGYKYILNKEDAGPDVFVFRKNKDYKQDKVMPTIGVTDNIGNRAGFGMVDIGGGFLNP